MTQPANAFQAALDKLPMTEQNERDRWVYDRGWEAGVRDFARHMMPSGVVEQVDWDTQKEAFIKAHRPRYESKQ